MLSKLGKVETNVEYGGGDGGEVRGFDPKKRVLHASREHNRLSVFTMIEKGSEMSRKRTATRKKKLVWLVVSASLATGGFVAATGAGFAAGAPRIAAFRLSNFSGTIANVCVRTDVAKKCSGNFAGGKSEVFQVKFKKPTGWSCTSTSKGLTGTASTVSFSRADVKECAVVGTIFGTNITLK
ncbi:hypothetical protein [Streptomyces sp. NBC_00829]|uniref:hypothetical protein n=1 Tax=Streptomyces sp. NBC_00829 TaxID=2903679 RepID=UPI003870313D|nr:hypothetical protein OG293_26010 [Streptomyces sp. NBC_00829]